jgi:hypothetical protein
MASRYDHSKRCTTTRGELTTIDDREDVWFEKSASGSNVAVEGLVIVSGPSNERVPRMGRACAAGNAARAASSSGRARLATATKRGGVGAMLLHSFLYAFRVTPAPSGERSEDRLMSPQVAAFLGSAMRFTLLLGVLLLAPPLIAASDPPPPPLAVVASFDTTSVRVSWVPPTPLPDAYNVYGVTSTGDRVLLDSTGNLTLSVVSGYANYAVTSVVGSQESTATYGCVKVDPGEVPPATITCNLG